MLELREDSSWDSLRRESFQQGYDEGYVLGTIEVYRRVLRRLERMKNREEEGFSSEDRERLDHLLEELESGDCDHMRLVKKYIGYDKNVTLRHVLMETEYYPF